MLMMTMTFGIGILFLIKISVRMNVWGFHHGQLVKRRRHQRKRKKKKKKTNEPSVAHSLCLWTFHSRVNANDMAASNKAKERKKKKKGKHKTSMAFVIYLLFHISSPCSLRSICPMDHYVDHIAISFNFFSTLVLILMRDILT
jgi:hypothetical protein